jgi:hypothetical protein
MSTLFDDLPAAPKRPDLPELQGSERMRLWGSDIRETLLTELYRRLEERRRLADITRERGQDTAKVDASIAAHAEAIAQVERRYSAGWFIDRWTAVEKRLGIGQRSRETKARVCGECIGELLKAKGD